SPRDEDSATLRARVTSPGGTTERALGVFEQGDLRGLIARALRAAHDRSEELATLLDAD
ncbi:MAG TPA: pyrroline-5-carboxylate reductase dimerization domain-containing protein, partial [Gammaproteobacteria bacterium]